MFIYKSSVYQNAKNKFYKTKVVVVDGDIPTLQQAVCQDYVMSEFKDNERSKANFISSDCLYADLDNSHSDIPDEWMTITKFQDIFKDVKHYIITSRNNLKEKDGKSARPKFHILFPIETIVDADAFENHLIELTSRYDYLDPAVKDCSRFFFGFDNSEIYFNDGNSVLIYLASQEAYRDVSKSAKTKKSKPKEIKYNEEGKIKEGYRHRLLFEYACSLKSRGFSDAEILSLISDKNIKECENPISDADLKHIVSSSTKYNKVIRNYQTKTNDEGETHIYPIVSLTDLMLEPASEMYAFENEEGLRLLYLKQNDYFIATPSQFAEGLRQIGYDIDFRNKGKSKSEYLENIKNCVQVYDRFSYLPELNPDTRTKYSFKKIEPKETGYFRKLMGIFTLETIKDEYRLASGFLSGFLDRNFDGEKPFTTIISPHQSSGKTTVAREGIKIIQGIYPVELDAEKDDKEAISSRERIANKYAYYDNLTFLTNKERTQITKYITDKYIPAHFMFQSHSRVRNNKTYFGSFNSENGLNTDVLERALVVRMRDGRDIPSEQKIKISKLLQAMSSHREEIIADILFYFSKIDWGIPPAKKYIAHQKCALWSEKITKILEVIYPEIEEFDYSLSDEDRAIDDDLSHLNELLEDLMTEAKKDWVFVSNREMAEKFQRTFGLNERSATKVYVARRLKAMAKSISIYRIEQDRMSDEDGKRSRGWRITKI